MMDGELDSACDHFLAPSWDNMKHVIYYAQRAQVWWLTLLVLLVSLPVFLGIMSQIKLLTSEFLSLGEHERRDQRPAQRPADVPVV